MDQADDDRSGVELELREQSRNLDGMGYIARVCPACTSVASSWASTERRRPTAWHSYTNLWESEYYIPKRPIGEKGKSVGRGRAAARPLPAASPCKDDGEGAQNDPQIP
jgi:hypothetical protein